MDKFIARLRFTDAKSESMVVVRKTNQRVLGGFEIPRVCYRKILMVPLPKAEDFYFECGRIEIEGVSNLEYFINSSSVFP